MNIMSEKHAKQEKNERRFERSSEKSDYKRAENEDKMYMGT